MTSINSIENAIKSRKPRSAWNRGVQAYALELLADLPRDEEYSNAKLLVKAMLNGASSWSQYSWGGCTLIYDGDIAKRLCNASELKKTRNGTRRPNSSEEWLDAQARALYQAARMIVSEAIID